MCVRLFFVVYIHVQYLLRFTFKLLLRNITKIQDGLCYCTKANHSNHSVTLTFNHYNGLTETLCQYKAIGISN